MEPNKILSASLLDLVFDDRNKEYGAYELRFTYPDRIKRSLVFVFVISGLALGGMALANKLKPADVQRPDHTDVTLTVVDLDKPEVIPPTPPPKKQDPPVARTEQYTPPVITDDSKVENPPPTNDDLAKAVISTETKPGVDADGPLEVKDIDGQTGIMIEKSPESKEPFRAVEIEAKFIGDWPKFLFRNLNGNVPVDNEAPPGKYTVLVEFVVDLDGSVSNIVALTNHGFGMEQEAIRVIKKASKWEPAFQNGTHVKAYRRQPITFIVEGQ